MARHLCRFVPRSSPSLLLGAPRSATLRRSSPPVSRWFSQLSRTLPQGTWDSHMHVVEPDRFPLAANAKYRPKPHTLLNAQSFYKSLGIENMVFVQPSIYGTDNSCMLEALRAIGPRNARAVVELDPATIQHDTLQGWHEIGVRGARVNLVSVARDVTESQLKKELEQYARVIRPLGWALQLYIPLKLAATLEKIVVDLDVPICIDHFGSPTLTDPYDPTKTLDPYSLPGFESLVRMLQKHAWVKFSAPYRISRDAQMRDLEPIGRELLKEAPNRVIYATDWPHTRYEKIDPIPFIEMCHRWCGSGTGLAEKLFRLNAEKLWDI